MITMANAHQDREVVVPPQLGLPVRLDVLDQTAELLALLGELYRQVVHEAQRAAAGHLCSCPILGHSARGPAPVTSCIGLTRQPPEVGPASRPELLHESCFML